MQDVVQALLRALQEEDENIRSAAASAVYHLGPRGRAAVPLLRQALEQKAGGSGVGPVVWALGGIGKDAAEAIPALRELLRSEDDSLCSAAAIALARVGEPAEVIPLLLQLLDRIDPDRSCGSVEDWASVAFVLGDLGEPARDAIPVLARHLGNRYASPYAFQALGKFGRAAVPALREALRHTDPEICERAIGVLGEMGQEAEEALVDLLPLLKERGASTASAAGEADDAGLAPTIEDQDRALQDTDRQLRCRAAAQLAWQAAAPASIPALLRAIADEDHEVRGHAEKGFARLGPLALPALLRAAKDPDPKIRAAVARALGEIQGTREGVPALAEAMRDPDSNVRFWATLAAGKLGGAAVDALPALIERLQDPQSMVRGYAGQSLGSLGEAARPAIPALLQALARESDWFPHRTQVGALRAAGADPDEVIAILEKLLGHEARLLRQVAAESLGFAIHAQAPHALPVVCRALGHQESNVRLAAIEAVRYLPSRARELLPSILRAMTDSEPEVRCRATSALGDLLREAGAELFPD